MPADIIGLVISTIAQVAADPTYAKLERSERVIRVLKRCKIDRLPSLPDFDTIYAYSLVYYGIDKPSHVREIFRDTWVKDAFKVLVYDSDAGHFENEIDALIARKIEAGDTQYHRVDMRSEMVAFGRVFWDIVHKTRTPGEVEAIQEIRGFRSEYRTEMATLLSDFAEQIAQQIGETNAQSFRVSSTRNDADHLRMVLQGSFHSLASQTLEEHRLHDYFAASDTINILRNVVFSILDSSSLSVQVKYGLVGKVDFDLLHKQVGVLAVSSFDRSKAIARTEEVLRSLIDIEAVVLALTGFIEMKTTERSGDIRIEDLRDELEQLLVPFIDDEELQTAIGDAVETGLPDPSALGLQVHKLCASAIETAAGRL